MGLFKNDNYDDLLKIATTLTCHMKCIENLGDIMMDIDCRLSKVEAFQEGQKTQLNEANAIIKSLRDSRSRAVKEYIKKWGVK